MKKEQVLNCKFSNWYQIYKDHSIKSISIDLPENFVEYLKDNGPLVLPRGVAVVSSYYHHDDDEDNLSHWEAEQSSTIDKVDGPDFPNVVEEIQKTIHILRGNVFPKFTWSSPRDASWMNHNTLKCTNPGEIILLLKSSDFVAHDLTSALSFCEDYDESDILKHELTLRKWANLVPGMEFRCFVKDRKLLGVSQRYCTQHFEYLASDCEQLADEIAAFIDSAVIAKFPDSCFVADLYKKRDESFWIIDFNPFCETTESLLFTWEELSSGTLMSNNCSAPLFDKDGEMCGQFRYTASSSTLQPSGLLSCRMPVDFVDLSTGNDATKLVDFLRMQKMQDDEDSDSDDEWKLPCDR